MKKNVASQVVGAQINSRTDGSPVTTGTTTVYVTGDGGTQATGSVGSGACTHEGHGFWTYTPAQAETNFDHVAFTFENSSGVNASVQIFTSFPQTGDNFARIGAPVGASISADVAGVPDAVLKRDMSAVTGESARSLLNAIRFLRNKWTLSGATLSVKKEDDTTEAWAATVTTDPSSEPITGSDPG